ncbi:hypothetical protein WME89_20380 [Sorangium sp. So ce321]|uniref:copper oxidase n=1 Tax=Sorangium sp. So ce321 TaxID=3133300 RepID=UPI003F642853
MSGVNVSSSGRSRWIAIAPLLACAFTAACAPGVRPLPAQPPGGSPPSAGGLAPPASCKGTVTANVVALDHPIMYSRMGASQPGGMIFALERDVEERGKNFILRPDKRPRPLVLRVNVGDCLKIHFTNRLSAQQPSWPLPPPPSPQVGGRGTLDIPGLPLRDAGAPNALPGLLELGDAGVAGATLPPLRLTEGVEQTATVTAGVSVMGLNVVRSITDTASFVGANPSGLAASCEATPDGAVPQNCSATYDLFAEREGTYLLHSSGAATDLFMDAPVLGLQRSPGGQVTKGLFGAVHVEPEGSSWYRSQVTREELVKATRPPRPGQKPGEHLPIVDYEATEDGTPGGLPILNMLHRHRNSAGEEVNEIVHSDLTAVITGPNHGPLFDPKRPDRRHPDNPATPERWRPFREFTTIYHEDFLTVQGFREFVDGKLVEILKTTADHFGINYGMGGIGAEVLANRFGVGPAAKCPECKFEEFFLSSWPNGDPATLVDVPAGISHETNKKRRATKAFYPDDPSNVYHSYLNDPLRFRVLHGGGFVPHVHHVHTHQWLRSPDNDKSALLDAQSIGPGSGYTLEIAYGGSGNRNRSPGDSVFHCHFYPHFAVGMWALWRVHDVFEWGTELDADGRPKPGARALPDGEIARGTPIPAVVPVPTLPMAPLPAPVQLKADGTVEVEQDEARLSAIGASKNPGYPFFVPGIAGHRPPQPPLDFAFDAKGQPHDGGLPRHVVRSGRAKGHETPTDFSKEIQELDAMQLPHEGTPVEIAAMDFHAQRQHKTLRPDGTRGDFKTNGKPSVPGAPFADPCGDWGQGAIGEDELVTFKGTAFEKDVVFNKKGWHNPRQRILALWDDVDAFVKGEKPASPLIVRARSRDCIRFLHSNALKKDYELPKILAKTPTDILGQHIHLVKFDVLSADGGVNGWNYEDGTFSPGEVEERIQAINRGGGLCLRGACDEGGTRSGERKHLSLRPFTPDATRGTQAASRATAASWQKPGVQVTVQRWWADPLLDNPEPGRAPRDRTLRTVFTHDHFAPSTHQHAGVYGALVVEPTGSRWTDPVTGEPMHTRADGGPTSFQAIIEPDPKDPTTSYREFVLLYQNLQPAYWKQGGQQQFPVNGPPGGAQVVPDPVVGTYSVNYRSEPLPFRVAGGAGGRKCPDSKQRECDLAFAFSSIERSDPALNRQPPGPPLTPGVEGPDPYTPMLRAYQGDKVEIKTLPAAQADMFPFHIHGLRWLQDASDPNSGYRNTQVMGLAEHFEFAFTVPPASAGTHGDFADHLYLPSAIPTATSDGLWGLLRAYRGARGDLRPLASNPGAGAGAQPTGCPVDAPRRPPIEVVAAHAADVLPDGAPGLVYYQHGQAGQDGARSTITDEQALLYVLREDLEGNKLKPGKRPEPLVLRARAGECITVKLTNQFSKERGDVFERDTRPPGGSFPPCPNGASSSCRNWKGRNDYKLRLSPEVGLHADLVAYDVNRADGFNVGYNRVQTAAPGESITYEWYAGKTRIGASGEVIGTPVELGAVNLQATDMIMHHRHSLVGSLIVEPEGSRWVEDANSRLSATVYPARGDAFREHVLLVQEDLRLNLSQADRPVTQSLRMAFNYGTEHLVYRYGAEDTNGRRFANDDISCAMSNRLWVGRGIPRNAAPSTAASPGDLLRLPGSEPIGEPNTPVFVAAAGTPVRIRTLHASADDHLMSMLTVHGHSWQSQPFTKGSTVLGYNPTSAWTGAGAALSMTDRFDILLPSAGGPFGVPGDYLLADFLSFRLGNGTWGLFRVTERGRDAVVITNRTSERVTGVVSVFPEVHPGGGALKTGQFAPSVTVHAGTPAQGGGCSGPRLGPPAPVSPQDGTWTFNGQGIPEKVCVQSEGGGVAGWDGVFPGSCDVGVIPRAEPMIVGPPVPPVLRALDVAGRKAGVIISE